MLFRLCAKRFHSAFAVGERCAGQVGWLRGGCGSCPRSGRLPGLPSMIFSRVGFGLRPRMTSPAALIDPAPVARLRQREFLALEPGDLAGELLPAGDDHIDIGWIE